MVLEALAALGVASNVVQFVDFASRLTRATIDLRKSPEGTTDRIKELEALARNVKEHAEANTSQSLSRTAKADVAGFLQDLIALDMESWHDLNRQCLDLADRLISLLQTLKLKEKSTLWQSICRGASNIWRNGDLEELVNRLDRISNHMFQHLQLKRQDRISCQLDHLMRENSRLEAS